MRKKQKKVKLTASEKFKKKRLQFVIAALRRRSIVWPPRLNVLKAAYVGQQISSVSGRLSKHYQCNECSEAFPQSRINLDHVRPVGTKRDDWKWISRLLVPEKGWQVLCEQCHNKKTFGEEK